jgi:hypothetical protein
MLCCSDFSEKIEAEIRTRLNFGHSGVGVHESIQSSSVVSFYVLLIALFCILSEYLFDRHVSLFQMVCKVVQRNRALSLAFVEPVQGTEQSTGCCKSTGNNEKSESRLEWHVVIRKGGSSNNVRDHNTDDARFGPGDGDNSDETTRKRVLHFGGLISNHFFV